MQIKNRKDPRNVNTPSLQLYHKTAHVPPPIVTWSKIGLDMMDIQFDAFYVIVAHPRNYSKKYQFTDSYQIKQRLTCTLAWHNGNSVIHLQRPHKPSS